MSPAQYTKLAAQLATTHDVLERLQHCVKPANSPGLIADVIAMQGIVARMARNSWALMDEAQQGNAVLHQFKQQLNTIP
jgi:phosphopentomutase